MAGSKKSYNLEKAQTKHDTFLRKRHEKAARKAYAAERRAQSYEDKQFTSWKIQLNKIGLELRAITPDGNCLFRALGDQLDGNTDCHLKYRLQVCDYMESNEEDFAPFVDEDTTFVKHLEMLRNPGTFAGNDAIVAFTRLKEVTVVIHHLGAPAFRIDGTCTGGDVKELHLSYHNGEHYSSIRQLGDRDNTPAKIKIKMPDSSNNNNGEDDYDVSIPKLSEMTQCSNMSLLQEAVSEFDGDLDSAADYIRSLMVAEDSASNNSADSTQLTDQKDSSSQNSIPSSRNGSVGSTKSFTSSKQKPMRKADKKRVKKAEAAERRKRVSAQVSNASSSNDNDPIFEVTTHLAVLSV